MAIRSWFARYAHGCELGDQLDALAGKRPVAGEVAEPQHLVDTGVSQARERGPKRQEIAVDVRQHAVGITR
jgi:hypothetical protein